MKYLPFKILIVCVLIPPILYVLSMQAMERYLHGKYSREIQNIYLGNTQSLLDGSVRLKNAVSGNIKLYLESKTLLSLGVKSTVRVTTQKGMPIYPAGYDEEDGFEYKNPVEIASENYRLMNEGLRVDLDLEIEQLSWISSGVLLFYLLVSIVVLYGFYRIGLKRAQTEEREVELEIARLGDVERKYQETLRRLEAEKGSLISEYEILIRELEKEKQNASHNEENMIDEMVALEEKINENLKQQEEQQAEIQTLKEELSRYEKGKTKTRASDSISRRFAVIYKNLVFHEKAIEGFADLTENMKIKAEEIIQQLNHEPALVQVKRKVFGKKNRETVLEVVFSYKGRLYFRRMKDNKIEIVTIGTKNDQDRDLEFLDRLDRVG